MALVVADRIKETTSTTGTGTYTLAGASSGFEAFSVIGNSNTTYYCCTDGTDFEVGIGTYTASGTTLARTTILQSSNSDSAVNWGSGTRDIFVTQPAEKAVFKDASGHIQAVDGRNLTNLSAGNLTGTIANARLDQQLQDVAGLAVTNGNFIVGDGANFVAESGSTARTSLGLGTASVLDTGISNTNIAKFTTGVVDNDFLRVDGTSIEGRSASEVLSDISAAPAAGDSNILTVGALDSGSITSGFGSIDIGSSALSTTGSVTLGATSFGDNNITNVGSIALDSIASDAGVGTAVTFSAGNVPNTQTAGSQTGNITPDFSQYTNFILTLTGNIVLQDPGDEVAGQSGIFVFIQDGTGSRTLSHADDRYFVAGGTSITLSTGANAIDIVPYFVQADGKIHLGAAQKAFAEA